MQIDLLHSILAEEASLHMQATALRCIVCLVEKAAHFVPINAFAFHTLFKLVDRPNMPPPMRCDVLRIFLKVISLIQLIVPAVAVGYWSLDLDSIALVTDSCILGA